VGVVENSFRVPQSAGEPFVYDRPKFCPGLSTLRQDNVGHTNMVVVHEAPYLLLQRIVADRPENPFELEIMKSKR